MVKLLQIALIVILAWLAYRVVRQFLARTHAGPKPRPVAPAGNMVRCVHCGVHVPESEAINERGRYYCSREHYNASADG